MAYYMLVCSDIAFEIRPDICCSRKADGHGRELEGREVGRRVRRSNR